MDERRSAVAYCRVSTFEQKRHGHGIDIQIRDVTVFAERQGLLVRAFYRDEGESGIKKRRSALRRLLKDCRGRRVALVIIPSLDRLSRNVRIAEELFHEFEQLGVEVLIADMPSYNGKDRKDVLIRQIREAIAEENRKDIIERLWKGRQERVRRGLAPGGNAPYGFRRRDGDLVPDDSELTSVRIIFDLEARKIPRSAMVKLLTRHNRVRRNGKSWSQRQIAAILSRRRFYETGALRYGDVLGKNPRYAVIRLSSGGRLKDTKWHSDLDPKLQDDNFCD